MTKASNDNMYASYICPRLEVALQHPRKHTWQYLRRSKSHALKRKTEMDQLPASQSRCFAQKWITATEEPIEHRKVLACDKMESADVLVPKIAAITEQKHRFEGIFEAYYAPTPPSRYRLIRITSMNATDAITSEQGWVADNNLTWHLAVPNETKTPRKRL